MKQSSQTVICGRKLPYCLMNTDWKHLKTCYLWWQLKDISNLGTRLQHSLAEVWDMLAYRKVRQYAVFIVVLAQGLTWVLSLTQLLSTHTDSELELSLIVLACQLDLYGDIYANESSENAATAWISTICQVLIWSFGVPREWSQRCNTQREVT